MRRIQTTSGSTFFFVILLIFLHDLPLFNFESLLTDQFLHFTNLNRIQIAISFLFFKETPQSNDKTVSLTFLLVELKLLVKTTTTTQSFQMKREKQIFT